MNFDEIIRRLKKEYEKHNVTSLSKLSEIKKDPFLVLVSCLISLRTKDEVTYPASLRLFRLADNPKKMSKLNLNQIEKAIYPAGFYKTKAKRIREISKIINDKYNGEVPGTLEELLKLKGVGRKTANIVITFGYGKSGIAVDTHVHRISNRLGIVKTKNPDETEFALMKILPEKYWIDWNDLLVMYGQNVCKPISPFCSKCVIIKYCKRINVDKSR